MSFFGKTFIFNGVPSEAYGLYISTPDGGDGSFTAGSGIEPITEKIYRRPVPYMYGVDQTPVLEIPLSVYSDGFIDQERSQRIERWLFGQTQYQKLIIVQNDLQVVYYNCFLTEPQKTVVGNQITGYNFTALCDAPWGWTNEINNRYTYSANSPTSTIINITMSTDNNYYTFPTVVFTMNTLGGNFSLTNQSDNNRVFSFTGLLSNEEITVQNDLGIITSKINGVDSGFFRVQKFNKNLFRMVKGLNKIQILGNVLNLSIKYKLAKKTGG